MTTVVTRHLVSCQNMVGNKEGKVLHVYEHTYETTSALPLPLHLQLHVVPKSTVKYGKFNRVLHSKNREVIRTAHS
jgi:hypothetical protein